MLMIDKAEVEGAITAIKSKLNDARRRAEGLDDIRKTIQTKESQMWRSDMGSCAGGLCNISSLIDMEMAILQQAIEAVESEDIAKAEALLDNYVAFVHRHYDNERTPY